MLLSIEIGKLIIDNNKGNLNSGSYMKSSLYISWNCLIMSALIIVLFFTTSHCAAQKVSEQSFHHIIPAPAQIEVLQGITFLDQDWTIYYEQGLQSEAEYLQYTLIDMAGLDLEAKPSVSLRSQPLQSIHLRITKESNQATRGAYDLWVSDAEIVLNGQDPSGVFYAIQTLLQWGDVQQGATILPQGKITDAPRFRHRGMLLDCSRHFFSTDVVKKYIDLLARYKMNVLHWHLTEDQGWRIEIDAYPRLTEIGAWRTEADGSRYGGYYSKAEIRDIVAYAAKRHVTVIPEIELPGHSLAALDHTLISGVLGGHMRSHQSGAYLKTSIVQVMTLPSYF